MEAVTVRRPWHGILAVSLILGLVAAATVLDRGGSGRRPGRGRASGDTQELGPVLVSSHEVEVPPGLTDAAGEAGDLVTFATEETGPDSELFRLWRLDLGSGTLIPGPVVARILDLRLQPDAENRRLVYLVEGGSLFRLTGFLASRPARVAGGVSAFDLSRRRAPFGASVMASPTGSGARIRLGRVAGRLDRGGRDVHVGRVEVEGVRVRGSTVHAWGTRGGRGIVLTARRGRLHVDPAPGGVVDVAPDGRLLLGSPEGTARLADRSGSVAAPLGLEVRSVSAWSPDGRWLAAVGSVTSGVGGLWLTSTEGGGVRQLDRWAEEGAPAAFSSNGRLALWAEAGAIDAFDLRTGATFRVSLPDGFPRVIGPMVAG